MWLGVASWTKTGQTPFSGSPAISQIPIKLLSVPLKASWGLAHFLSATQAVHTGAGTHKWGPCYRRSSEQSRPFHSSMPCFPFSDSLPSTHTSSCLSVTPLLETLLTSLIYMTLFLSYSNACEQIPLSWQPPICLIVMCLSVFPP